MANGKFCYSSNDISFILGGMSSMSDGEICLAIINSYFVSNFLYFFIKNLFIYFFV